MCDSMATCAKPFDIKPMFDLIAPMVCLRKTNQSTPGTKIRPDDSACVDGISDTLPGFEFKQAQRITFDLSQMISFYICCLLSSSRPIRFPDLNFETIVIVLIFLTGARLFQRGSSFWRLPPSFKYGPTLFRLSPFLVNQNGALPTSIAFPVKLSERFFSLTARTDSDRIQLGHDRLLDSRLCQGSVEVL
jgi:hypothetical protein